MHTLCKLAKFWLKTNSRVVWTECMWLEAVNTADMQSTIVRALVMCTYEEASHQGIFAESLTSDNV